MTGDALIGPADGLNKNTIVREIVTKHFAQPQQRGDAVDVAAGVDDRADFIAEGSRTSIALPRSSVPLT